MPPTGISPGFLGVVDAITSSVICSATGSPGWASSFAGMAGDPFRRSVGWRWLPWKTVLPIDLEHRVPFEARVSRVPAYLPDLPDLGQQFPAFRALGLVPSRKTTIFTENKPYYMADPSCRSVLLEEHRRTLSNPKLPFRLEIKLSLYCCLMMFFDPRGRRLASHHVPPGSVVVCKWPCHRPPQCWWKGALVRVSLMDKTFV